MTRLTLALGLALDAVATASRESDAVSLDVLTTVDDGPDQRLLLSR